MTTLNHEISAYDPESPYYMDNITMMEKYSAYVAEYANSSAHFLELGIGHGRTIEILRKNFDSLTVVDGERRFVDKYKKIYSDVEFVHSFFEDYAPNKPLDNVGLGFVLELLESPIDIVRRYASFLKPEGQIFVSVANAASLHRLVAVEAGLLADHKEMSDHHGDFSYQRFNDYSDWVNIFEQAGLKIVKSHGLMIKPFSTGQLNSLNLDASIYQALGSVAKDLPQIANASFFLLQC